MNGWFVTGTDTGVGKTLVSAAIARCRRDAGEDVVYVKPVQSGAADGDDDAADVAALAGVPTVVGPVIGPSLAPGVAARLAGEELAGAELQAVVASAARDHPGADVVVEGAGGLLVELAADGTTCADLAARLALPLVIVCRPGLGTLNHTALTVAAAAGRDLPVAGVVINGYPADPDRATRTNVAELERIAGGALLGIVPSLDLLGDDPLAVAADVLAPGLGGHWDGTSVPPTIPSRRTAP